jgi:hypothetical protein
MEYTLVSDLIADKIVPENHAKTLIEAICEGDKPVGMRSESTIRKNHSHGLQFGLMVLAYS